MRLIKNNSKKFLCKTSQELKLNCQNAILRTLYHFYYVCNIFLSILIFFSLAISTFFLFVVLFLYAYSTVPLLLNSPCILKRIQRGRQKSALIYTNQVFFLEKGVDGNIHFY